MADVTMDDIISMMVGRVIYERAQDPLGRLPPDAPVVLEVKGLRSHGGART